MPPLSWGNWTHETMSRHFAANFFNLLIIAMIALAGFIYWAKDQFYKPGPLQKAILIEVPRGGTIYNLSKLLEQEGAITNSRILRIGADYTQKSDQLKYGTYEIPAGASMADIIGIVTKGGSTRFRYVARYNIKVASAAELILRERSAEAGGEPVVLASFLADEDIPDAYQNLVEDGVPVSYQISVAEGTTSWQFIEALKAADFLDGPVPDVPPEGMVAPNTYEVRRGTARADVVALMVDAQSKILAEAWENRKDDLPLQTPEEALILASIIEKETGVKSERAEVAGVFINRLRQGMKLQTDPTVIYGLTEGKAPLGRGLRRSELSKETPYNTYVISGLPPGPIANPGRAAIEAALNPAETDNLFFVADGTGGHAFATNLADHNANVAKWRKIEEERRKAQENQ